MASGEQARLKSIVETAVDGIVTIDERGVIESFNPAAEQMFGYTADEIVGNNVSVLMPSPHREQHDDHLRRYLTTEEKRIIGIGREVMGCRKDGTKFPMRLSVGEFWLGDERLFTGIVHGLTEQKRVEERALQTERLAAMGQMMSVMTHESRNLLQITQTNLEMLTYELEELGRDRPATSDAMEYVRRIEAAQAKIHRLFEDLRGFAAPIVLDRQRCHLGRLVDRVLDELLSAGCEKRVQLNQSGTDADLQCHVDPLRLEQVFRNLLENSVAACPNPVAINVAYSETQFGDRPALRLAIGDNGPGFSPEHRRKVFEPFFTTKAKGTGLGLAITKRIIDSHGGQITVGNNGSPGVEFIIMLPREASPV